MNLRFLTTTIVVPALLTASSPARAQVPPAPPPLAPRAAPSALAPVASEPPEPKTELKSAPAVFAGSALIISGTAGSAVGLVLFIAASSIKCDDSPCDGPTTGPLVSLGIGLGALAAGIPLVIWGAQQVPRRTGSLPAWVGAPGGAGWRWRF